METDKQTKLINVLFGMLTEADQKKVISYTVNFANEVYDNLIEIKVKHAIDPDQTQKIPAKKGKEKRLKKIVVSVFGQEFKSMQSACTHFRKNYQTACNRRSNGWPYEKIFADEQSETVLRKSPMVNMSDVGVVGGD